MISGYKFELSCRFRLMAGRALICDDLLGILFLSMPCFSYNLCPAVINCFFRLPYSTS